MLLSIIMVIAGLLLLTWAAARLVDAAAALGRNLGVAPMIIGLTVVGFGTSAPEIVVSGLAAWQDHASLAIGSHGRQRPLTQPACRGVQYIIIHRQLKFLVVHGWASDKLSSPVTLLLYGQPLAS